MILGWTILAFSKFCGSILLKFEWCPYFRLFRYFNFIFTKVFLLLDWAAGRLFLNSKLLWLLLAGPNKLELTDCIKSFLVFSACFCFFDFLYPTYWASFFWSELSYFYIFLLDSSAGSIVFCLKFCEILLILFDKFFSLLKLADKSEGIRFLFFDEGRGIKQSWFIR